MATPKQVREHYRRIRKLYNKLEIALFDAHQIKVLDYENYSEESPCFSLYESKKRFEKTTEKFLAEAMRTEIMEGE